MVKDGCWIVLWLTLGVDTGLVSQQQQSIILTGFSLFFLVPPEQKILRRDAVVQSKQNQVLRLSRSKEHQQIHVVSTSVAADQKILQTNSS